MRRKIISGALAALITVVFLPRQTLAVSCSPPSLIPPDNTCSVSESVTVTAVVPDTSATFSGFAPASSTVTVKDNGTPAGTSLTNGSGQFTKTIITTPGTHDFSLFLTDTDGRTTPETFFDDINLPSNGDTQVPSSPAPPNINLPPTIALSRTSLTIGESISIFGQGAPGSTIHLVINGAEVYSSVVGGGSSWLVTTESDYQLGNNTVYAYLTRAGLSNSVNSFTLNFNVANCRRSDLNCDGEVNLTDFSILMYYWGTNNDNADTNDDGIVGLIDFSIMMFDWTE